MDFYHADSVCDNGERAEPDGNVVVMIKIIYRPHNKGDYDDPFEPHNVFCVDIPGKHTCGNYRYPGDGVCGYGGNRKSRLDDYESDFDSGGTFPFCNDYVSCNAYQRGYSAAVTSKKEMGKGVEPELKSLGNYIAVFVFNKADKYHYGAAHKRNYISEKNVHLFSTTFCAPFIFKML